MADTAPKSAVKADAPEQEVQPQPAAPEAAQPAKTAPERQPRARRRTKPAQKEAQKSPAQSPQGGILLFDKYGYDVEVQDLSLKNYINIKPIAYPMTFRRNSSKSFSKAGLNIVERLANSLMRGGTGSKVGGHVIRTKGRLQGKKVMTTRIIMGAFERISKATGKNPLQVLIRALENSAPIEDTTRVIYGGITSNVAVDISASRRLDIAIRNISMAAIIGAFGNKRSISDALANEIMLAANADINSYALKRKNEIERMARSAK